MRIPEDRESKDNEALRRRRGRRPAPPGPVDSSPLEAWTGFLLYRVTSIARSIYSKQMKPLHLRPTQVGILQLLGRSGPMIQGMIADKLGAEQPAMVSLIDEMERNGLVYRTRHPDDGRASIVRLSDQRSGQLARLDELNLASSDLLLAALTSDERSQLHDLLMKIYQSHGEE